MCIMGKENGHTESTILLSYLTVHPQKKRKVEVVGYYVVATSPHANAIIIVVPNKAGTQIGESNLIDTTGYEWIPPCWAAYANSSKAALEVNEDEEALVTSVGKFAVVAASNAHSINPAIEKVARLWPDRYIGPLAPNQINYFQDCFKTDPNQTVVIASWSGADKGAGFFALWHESPFGDETHWFAGEDLHDVSGDPRLVRYAVRDQILVIGRDGVADARELPTEPGMPWWIPSHGFVKDVSNSRGRNGNWVVELQAMPYHDGTLLQPEVVRMHRSAAV